MNRKYSMRALVFAVLAFTLAGAATADQAVILTARQLDMITAGDVFAVGDAVALGVGNDGALAVTDTFTLADATDPNQDVAYVNTAGLAAGDIYAGTITTGLVGIDGAAVGAYTGAEADGGVAASTLTVASSKTNKNWSEFRAEGEAVAIGDDPLTWAGAGFTAPDDAHLKYKYKVKTKTQDGISTTTLKASLRVKN